MSSIQNKHIYSGNQEWLNMLRGEYLDMGFDVSIEQGHLTVFAKKRKHKKSKEKDKPIRDKRREKFER